MFVMGLGDRGVAVETGVVAATNGVHVEWDAAVAAALRTEVHTHAAAAGGHVDLVLGVLAVDAFVGVEVGDAIPARLDHAAEGLTVVVDHNLLVAAALAVAHVAPEGTSEGEHAFGGFPVIDIWGHNRYAARNLGHVHVGGPGAIATAAEAHAAGRVLGDHGGMFAIHDELELLVGIAAAQLLEAALAGLDRKSVV